MKILLILSLCILGLSSCENGHTNQQNSTIQTTTVSDKTFTENTEKTAKKKKTILFFGNSLTAAYGLDPAEGFPALIQQKINKLGLDYNVVNAGNSGETSAGGNERINWLLKEPIDIFVLELGANDGLRGIDLTSTKKNLQSIISKVKKKYPEAKIVIAGMEVPPNLGEEYTREFRDMYKELAQVNNAILIPFLLDGVGDVPELNQADGIHPTAEGNKIVAENVWKVLEKRL